MLLLLIILIIIKYVSPDPDSVLYVLKKYLNFLIFKINNTISIILNINEKFYGIKTFKGINTFNDTTPKFVSYYENFFIKKMIEKNPLLNTNILKKLYNVIDNMVTLEVDDYFMTVSDSNPKNFTKNELNKISTILLNKLNLGEFKFTNLNIIGPVIYHTNVSGKEISPFLFTVNCDNNIGNLKIYIESDIRNDIIKDSSILIIKKIRINMDDVQINNNNILYINYDNNTDFIYNSVGSTELGSSELVTSESSELGSNESTELGSSELGSSELGSSELGNSELGNSELDSTEFINSTQIEQFSNQIKELSIGLPFIDFNSKLKSNIQYNIDASNNNDTYMNMLDNIEIFKIE